MECRSGGNGPAILGLQEFGGEAGGVIRKKNLTGKGSREAFQEEEARTASGPNSEAVEFDGRGDPSDQNQIYQN